MEFNAEIIKNNYYILNYSSNVVEKKKADEILCLFKVKWITLC